MAASSDLPATAAYEKYLEEAREIWGPIAVIVPQYVADAMRDELLGKLSHAVEVAEYQGQKRSEAEAALAQARVENMKLLYYLSWKYNDFVDVSKLRDPAPPAEEAQDG